MFSNSVKIFSLMGFDVKLDPSWALIAALITWGLSREYFPHTVPGLTPQTYLIMALAAMLCFFASLLLHEMAHSVVARRYGIEIKGITLFIFGGVAELGREPDSAAAEFWVALAGPAMSFALSAGFWILTQVSLLTVGPALTEVLAYLALINLILALFNLVPAFPLDGGRVLRAWLWNRSGDILSATETASKSGAVFGGLLMVIGVMSLFRGGLAAGLWYLMIGLFVLGSARASYQSQLAQAVFDGKTVAHLLTRDPVTVSPDMTIKSFINDVLLKRHMTFVPVVEDGVILGHIDHHLIAGIDRENRATTRVGDVYAGLQKTDTVSPDLPLQDLMTRIAKTGQRKFLVLADHRLVGVITLSDLTRYLRMADMLRHDGVTRSP
jgi:Zn-dependent protease/CBS domain-containing protein